MKTICKLLPILFSLCFTSCTSDVDTNKIESSTLYNNDSLSAVTELNDDSCLHFDLSSVPDITIDLEPDEQEKEKVREIVENAIVALQTQDFKGMAKYIDFEIWYYAAHGKEGTAEEISKGLEDNKDNTEGAAFWFVPRSHYYTFDSAEQIKPEYFLLENAEQSVFFSSEIYEKYKIGKAFRVNVTETYNGNSYNEEIIVAEINGVMKADYAFSMDKKYHDEVLKIALAEQEKEKMNLSSRK